MSTRFSPQECIVFQNFLKEKQDLIMDKITGAMSIQLVNTVFEVLQAELMYEFNQTDKEMEALCQ